MPLELLQIPFHYGLLHLVDQLIFIFTILYELSTAFTKVMYSACFDHLCTFLYFHLQLDSVLLDLLKLSIQSFLFPLLEAMPHHLLFSLVIYFSLQIFDKSNLAELERYFVNGFSLNFEMMRIG